VGKGFDRLNKTFISLLVSKRNFCMLTTIEFYNDSSVKRNEVNNIPFSRLLTTELDTFKLAAPQISPERTLCICGVLRRSRARSLKGYRGFIAASPTP
jgi:hypothetical protein